MEEALFAHGYPFHKSFRRDILDGYLEGSSFVLSNLARNAILVGMNWYTVAALSYKMITRRELLLRGHQLPVLDVDIANVIRQLQTIPLFRQLLLQSAAYQRYRNT